MICTFADVPDVLDRGDALVVPNAYPLTRVVAATTAQAVNAAKMRPLDQPVAVWAWSASVWGVLAQHVDLQPDSVVLARRLLRQERLTLLLPVTDDAANPWVRSATYDGYVLVFGSCWEPARALLDRPLFVSSANVTGRDPVVTTAESLREFGDRAYVVAGDIEPDAAEKRSATTTLRFDRGGTVTLTRRGAQDSHAGGPVRYLASLGLSAEGVSE